MKERPILFSAPMVKAILSGSKSQTRRVVKPQPVHGAECVIRPFSDQRLHYAARDLHDMEQGLLVLGEVPKCPYGQPDDRLWVRETWMDLQGTGVQLASKSRYAYGADTIAGSWDDECRIAYGLKWKPSIHMPRAACRITLEIAGVRVERLQAISEADAKAEGCDRLDDDEPGYVHREEPDWKLCPRCGGTRLYTAFSGNGGAFPDTDCRECDTYQKRYRLLWEQINGPGSWDANPWVWVVEFRVMKPGEVNQQGATR